jgi:transposase-like protein
MKRKISTGKERKWKEYEVLEYVAALREKQKKDPAPMILRSKINHLACILYLDGYTCLEIRKLLSLAKCTVYRILKRKGLFKAKDRSIPEELERNVVELYLQGKGRKEIGSLLNVSTPSIRWILIKNNIPARNPRVFVKKEKPGKKTLEEAVRMYREGIPYKDIKTATGVNNSQLYDTVHESGLPMRGGRSVKSKERIAAEEEAIRLYRDTDTYTRKIQEKTGIPFSTLSRLLKARNIPLRGNPQLKEEQIEEAIGLYREGWTNSAIYKKTGVSPGGLTWILQSRNIPLKGRRESSIDKKLQEKVVQMYREGYMLKDIRKETGVRDISDVLKRYGIPRNRRS